ncbi:MAG: hypothetical protein ACFFAN_20225 [Promethearchaeota archaeon]
MNKTKELRHFIFAFSMIIFFIFLFVFNLGFIIGYNYGDYDGGGGGGGGGGSGNSGENGFDAVNFLLSPIGIIIVGIVAAAGIVGAVLLVKRKGKVRLRE